MKKPLIIIMSMYLGHCINAQERVGEFTLRQSFQSKNDKAEPAEISFSKAKGKDASWLLNAAIGYNWNSLTKNLNNGILIISPYAEYHRNTIVGKEQNNWQAGVSAEWQINSIEMDKSSWSPLFITAAKYNNDNIKDNTSFQGNLYFTPLFKGRSQDPKYFWIPNIYSQFGNRIQFTYSPYIGVENENRINTKNPLEKGNIYRFYTRITATLSLFPNLQHKERCFEINGDLQYRNNFSENVEALTVKNHTYFTSSINYVFYSSGTKSYKVGADYTTGENPAKNFEKQSFYTISLKIKL